MAIDGGLPYLRPGAIGRFDAIPDEAQQKAHEVHSVREDDHQRLINTVRSSGFRRPLRWANPYEVALHHRELQNVPATRAGLGNPYTQLPDSQLVKALGIHFSMLENFHEK
ncbi:hypothetical protein [Pseudomonas fluorescens]|uniref:hypothetical protein n=1 Tax=Pseudomonas fluorescens TaxID=294 RepID=UPI001BEC1C68|nr:hypothetical protein [Pseudomonas fluorescens]MBT2375282.1 hypothetical protein [Pseudomonas fluorescens]